MKVTELAFIYHLDTTTTYTKKGPWGEGGGGVHFSWKCI